MSLRVASVWLLTVSVVAVSVSAATAKNSRAARVQAERQPVADLGDGYYRNPILPGNHGGNNHHSILEDKGRWIIRYHGSVPKRHRMVRGEYVHFNEDGTIRKIPSTEKGVGPLPASDGAYLFAHMTKQDYGRLYYAVSEDGLHWTTLNDGKRINDEYRGHPDITKGHDGRHYMTGGSGSITLWVSDDLLAWSKLGEIEPNVYEISDFEPKEKTYGAAKIYYDETTQQYLITWHTSQHKKVRERPEHYWAGQRTCYVTTRDFRAYTDPHRLFQYDMATIDVIVRRVGARYYAILKDERYPSFDWTTGKTIRVASAPTLTGPWTRPSSPITPNFREAPTLIRRPDDGGWYLYYEQYPGVQYGLSTAPTIAGPWHGVYIKDYDVPENARHGCMIPVTRAQYNAIVARYGR